MSGTVNIAVPADLVPLLRALAEDGLTWAQRLRHDWGGLSDVEAQRIASHANSMANDCSALVRAIDAAQEAELRRASLDLTHALASMRKAT